jgi:hypothetical protein
MNETYLLDIAHHGTAAHVERLVCNYRKVQRIAERQRANTLHEQRSVKFHHDDGGALILEARLPPEAGAIVLEALAAAGEAMYARRGKNSAEFFRDTDIETLNREQGLDIDADTCVFPGNGERMDVAMAVEGMLQCDGALQLNPATGHYPAHFPPVRQ